VQWTAKSSFRPPHGWCLLEVDWVSHPGGRRSLRQLVDVDWQPHRTLFAGTGSAEGCGRHERFVFEMGENQLVEAHLLAPRPQPRGAAPVVIFAQRFGVWTL